MDSQSGYTYPPQPVPVQPPANQAPEPVNPWAAQPDQPQPISYQSPIAAEPQWQPPQTAVFPQAEPAYSPQPDVPTAPAPPPVPQDSQQYDPQDLLPNYLKPEAEELVYEWIAPSRPFKKRNRRYFTTVVTIALLISLILFFAGQLMPIAVVVAMAFVSYVMATIPPHDVTHRFTTYGIRIDDEIYLWEELGWFWFTDKYTDRVLHVEVGRFPYRLSMVLGPDSQEDDVRYILEAVLLENTPPLTYYEQIGKWIQEKIPLDID